MALLRAGSSVEAARRALCALRNLGHEQAVCEALTRLYHDQRRERAAAAAAVAVAVRKPLQPLQQPLAGTPEKLRPSGKQRRQQHAAAMWPTVAPTAAPLPPAKAATAATAAAAVAVAMAVAAVAQVQATEEKAAACGEQCKARAPPLPPPPPPPPPPPDSAGVAAIVQDKVRQQTRGGRPCRAVSYRGMIGK